MDAADKKATKKPAKANKLFTDEERAAMKDYVRERRAVTDKADGESDVLAKIAEMPAQDRAMAERLHALIKATVPDVAPRTWYGQPAYANKDGKIVCFFQPSNKFKTRYSTLGFNDAAHLDDGAMWPTAFALMQLTAADEAKITALVKKAFA